MSGRPHPRAYERHWHVRALRGLVKIYAQAWNHIDITERCRIPADGPAILICNHSAGVDPLLLQAACPRLVTWMIAKEYYDLPVLKPIFARLGYIPVARGSRDSGSLKMALRALSEGKVLGIFPEGRIEPSTELLPFQPGLALIADRAKVPIYPAYIAGLQRNRDIAMDLLDRHTVTLRFGPRLLPPECAPVTTETLFKIMEHLRKQTIAQMLHR